MPPINLKKELKEHFCNGIDCIFRRLSSIDQTGYRSILLSDIRNLITQKQTVRMDRKYPELMLKISCCVPFSFCSTQAALKMIATNLTGLLGATKNNNIILSFALNGSEMRVRGEGGAV
jgi:hypothetical protein